MTGADHDGQPWDCREEGAAGAVAPGATGGKCAACGALVLAGSLVCYPCGRRMWV